MVNYDRTGSNKIPMSKSAGSVVNVTSNRYMRPFNYNIPIPIFGVGGAVCLAANRQATPCKEFLLQADLANGSYISIGFQGTNLVNGLQLLGGQGWIFSVSGFGENTRIQATPTTWVQGLDEAQQALLGASQLGRDLFLNIADFWAAGAGLIAQNLIIFYMIVPGVNT